MIKRNNMEKYLTVHESDAFINPPKKTTIEGNVLTKEEVMEGRSSAYEFIDFDKQEMLEKAAQEYEAKTEYTKYAIYDAFIACAKWQQERSYSEEEVIELLKTFDENFNSGIVERNKGIKEWFEIFKKK